jgi:signal recognition particle subunit SRP19
VFDLVSKRDGVLVLWPAYFDAGLTRAEGRRVPKDSAVRDPKAGIIAEAAKSLGLDPVLEKEAAHPTNWWKPSGRVLVKKRWPKEETLRRIADRL